MTNKYIQQLKSKNKDIAVMWMRNRKLDITKKDSWLKALHNYRSHNLSIARTILEIINEQF
jgi:hypothetical protein